MAKKPCDMFDEGIVTYLEETEELELDALLLAASQEYEDARAPPTTTTTPSSTTPETRHAPQTAPRFATPKTSPEIRRARLESIPLKTQQDTKYCYNIWLSWKSYREGYTSNTIPLLQSMSNADLDYWLSRFVSEIRKTDGSEYPPNTLHHIIAGLQRHIRFHGKMVDLFKDPQFAKFRSTLDGEMKRLQAKGLGTKKRQAEVITVEEEEKLWSTGQLGDSTPQQLLDTIIYCCGYYFALCSGQEHRQLRYSPAQIELVEHPGERAYLKYQEDISINRPGGLKGRKISPKIVIHHANQENPQCCFVHLYKKYISLRPPNAPDCAFYLKPAKTPTSSCWYSRNLLGHNPLGTTIARICKSAGITGFKTNHSLRATSASRLYQSGVDEQMVMERTGHRSLDGVRSYKRTSTEQRESLSDIMNCPSRKVPRYDSSLRTPDKNIAVDGLQISSSLFSGCIVNFYLTKKE